MNELVFTNKNGEKIWFWPGNTFFNENWLNNLWNSSTSPPYLFPFFFPHFSLASFLVKLQKFLSSFQLFIPVSCPFSAPISIIISLTYLFMFSVSLAQLLGYFHLNPATSLTSYCALSSPTPELAEIFYMPRLSADILY